MSARETSEEDDMWPGMENHMGWMWLWPSLGFLVLALFVWMIARGGSGSAPGAPLEESPERIVKRRYARGEIDANEYERRLSDLRK
jgi:putative membrane protein